MVDGGPSIYTANVFHNRFVPIRNTFAYRVFYVVSRMSDLDAWRNCAVFAVNKPALFSFHESDHGDPATQIGAEWFLDVFKKHSIQATKQSLLVVTMPRLFGYAFNPVSFWISLDEKTDKILGVIAEVNNTFSERHFYICLPGETGVIRHGEWVQASKVFHVSPFLPREGSYRFRFDLSPGRLAIFINYLDKDGQVVLKTGMTGAMLPLTSKNMMRCFFTHPLIAFRIIGLIHWQALKLFIKGVKYKSKPEQLLEKITASNVPCVESVRSVKMTNEKSEDDGGVDVY